MVAKNRWLCGAALAVLAIAGPVQAADLKVAPPYKAPSPIAPSSWTGFYAGLGLGFRSMRTDVTTTSVDGDPVHSDEVASQPFDGVSLQLNPYVGINWQFARNWVAGLEGGVGIANQRTILAGLTASPATGFSGVSADGLAVRNTWDATLRGRLGFLLSPATMLYGTGGVAWQKLETTSTCGDLACSFNQSSPAVVTNTITKMGWTIGGGLETALGGHWLARAEYRYADFGSAPLTIARTETSGGTAVAFVDIGETRLRTHTATFGLAYKFGDPIAGGDSGDALAAFAGRSASVGNSWSGFYAGLGLGARASLADLTTTSSLLVDPVDLTGSAVTQPFNGTAFRVDPYFGFNWQFASRWVAGVEGDFGFGHQTTTREGIEASPASTSNDPASSLALTVKWDASLRGRVGFLATPGTLLYTTGGLAWQHYDVTSICGVTDPTFGDCVGVIPSTVTNSVTKAGWTIGGGAETALWDRWLLRAEYRYADFGTTPLIIARSFSDSDGQFVDTFDVKLRTHTVTFGLAYKFN